MVLQTHTVDTTAIASWRMLGMEKEKKEKICEPSDIAIHTFFKEKRQRERKKALKHKSSEVEQ